MVDRGRTKDGNLLSPLVWPIVLTNKALRRLIVNIVQVVPIGMMQFIESFYKATPSLRDEILLFYIFYLWDKVSHARK